MAFELKEKENLATAEMNRKEQEWRKRMGMVSYIAGFGGDELPASGACRCCTALHSLP